MDVHNTIGGSLQISTEVIAKIARLAALEVDGVADVATGTSQNVRSLLGRTGLQKPVTVVRKAVSRDSRRVSFFSIRKVPVFP